MRGIFALTRHFILIPVVRTLVGAVTLMLHATVALFEGLGALVPVSGVELVAVWIEPALVEGRRIQPVGKLPERSDVEVEHLATVPVPARLLGTRTRHRSGIAGCAGGVAALRSSRSKMAR
jgi:hypothetical protein